MEVHDIGSLVGQITTLIDVTISPKSDNASRIQAYSQLNHIIGNVCCQNTDLYLNVAMALIGKSSDQPAVDSFVDLYAHCGFKIINNIVQSNWYEMNDGSRSQLKLACASWCTNRLFTINNEQNVPNKISTSPIVLKSCSEAIFEMFARDWPNKWPDFVEEITKDTSLVTLQCLLQISINIATLFIPQNAVRRKEISKCFTQEKDKIFQYFLRCLAIFGSNNQNLSVEYKQLLVLKSLESLESLFEWYPLSQEIICRIFYLMTESVSTDEQFNRNLKMLCFKCVNTLLSRQNSRVEDKALLADIFFNFQPEKFSHYFITKMLPESLSLCRANEANQFEMFLLLLDIGVSLICKAITVFGHDSTDESTRRSMTGNREIWITFVRFCIDCLVFNNVLVDEIVLKFLLATINTANIEEPNERNFYPLVEEEIREKILPIIAKYKVNPKSTELVGEEEMSLCYTVDSYESYVYLFNQNRAKFFSFTQRFIQVHPHISKRFILSLLKDAVENFAIPNADLQRAIPAWNTTASLSSLIIPKLQFNSESQKILESFLERLILFARNKLFAQDSQVISHVLSCLSSMSTLYENFATILLQQLIELIFEFAIGNYNPKFTKQQTKELRNHSSALFIKLSIVCSKILLPFFDTMHSYIDTLVKNQQINDSQLSSLYEGLIILSNDFENLDQQRNFILTYLLPKINWFKEYDFGPDGMKFFTDISLQIEPNFSQNGLLFHQNETATRFMLAINLLPRMFKRIVPDRFFSILWPELLDYITPFYKLCSAFHQLWRHHGQCHTGTLNQFCHPYYQPFVFDSTPQFFLTQICFEQNFLLPEDRLKTLMAQLDSSSDGPLPVDLYGLHAQHRLNSLYANAIRFLGTTTNSLFHFYHTQPTSQPMIETFFSRTLPPFCVNIHSMPLIVYHDLIKYYFSHFAIYVPRSESFLQNSNITKVLSDFIPLMFAKLDPIMQAYREEQSQALEKPQVEPVIEDKQKDNLEICREISVKCIAMEFIHFLDEIFSIAKSTPKWLEKMQPSSLQPDEEMMVENEGDVGVKRNSLQFSEDGLLSAYLLSVSPSPVVVVVVNCLLWPVGIRSLIGSVNDRLIKSMIHRQMIQSPDAFYYLAERIILSVRMTEQSETETINQLSGLLLQIYEEVVVKHNLTSTINPQLSEICNVPVKQWNDFARLVVNGANVRTRQKMLRSLLANVSSKGLSGLHKNPASAIKCLNTGPKKECVESHESFNLSWLF